MLAPGTRLGVYEVVAAIGAGGMGEVYKAKDTRLDRLVAIKVLPSPVSSDPALRERFEREARTVAALNHPHICTLHDIGNQDGTDYLVLEYLDGQTLADRLTKGALPLDQALTIAIQVADALDKAHRKGIVHRDLKPANVMLTKSGVKLLDFGLAKVQPAGAVAEMSVAATMTSPLTAQGTIVGTLHYMAPEQVEGKDTDARSDIFSLGAILYEMTTGKRAFEGKSAASVIAAILERQPPAMSSLQPLTPPLLDHIVARCLAKDPDERWQSANDAMCELMWIANRGSALKQTTASSVTARTLWNRATPWTTATAILAVIGLAFVHFREVPPEAKSIRFQVPVPEGGASMFKLSPDGRYLVFVATRPSEQARLWVRALDTVELRPLAGTEGASFPFWSPDSTQIGFFAQGKLRRIAVAGGPSLTICDAVQGRGAAWSPDGIVVFAPTLNGGLYQVSEQGGTPVPVTKVDADGGSGDRLPEFLADGRRFLFYRTSTLEATGIHVGSLDGMAPVRILPDVSNARYVMGRGGGGYLVFRRENTLVAQPFDPVRLQATGEVVPLAEQVGLAGPTGTGAFSASDDGTLAFVSGPRRGNREVVWLDRSGKRLSAATKPDDISGLALSPDGSTAAVMIGDMSPGTDIWLQHLQGESLSRFTFGPRANGYPVWSPDGRRLLFTSLSGSGSSDELFEKPAGGAGKEEPVLRGPRSNTVASDWSPDGKFVTYSSTGEKTQDDLWILPMDADRKPVSLLQTPFNERWGQFSPDGKWLAYASDESGRYQVFVQPFPADGRKWQISTIGGRQPRWNRSGRELFYITDAQTLAAIPLMLGASLQQGTAQVLFKGISGEGATTRTFTYQPSPDGQRFLALVQAEGDALGPPPITIVTNWQTGLTK
jgi:Tol biopolymer transport system component